MRTRIGEIDNQNEQKTIKWIFFAFFWKNIWSYQKFVVILHAFSSEVYNHCEIESTKMPL